MIWKHTFAKGAKFNLRGIGHYNGEFCELCIRPDVYVLAMKNTKNVKRGVGGRVELASTMVGRLTRYVSLLKSVPNAIKMQ